MTGSSTLQGVKRQAKLSTTSIEGQVQRAISCIAESDSPVLLVGECGAGKRTIAAQIHAQSARSRNVYKEMQSAEIGEQELRSAIASKGTIYLAEIGSLNLGLQKLIVDLYFHAEKAPGSRLLFGTSRELVEDVKAWRMREDFYYCISAVTLQVSPLRFRKAEILPLTEALLTHYANQFDRPKPALREEMIDFLMNHRWPGNLSELQTAIKTFVAIGEQSISLAALKASTLPPRSNGHRKPVSLKEATRAASIQIEHQLISEALLATGGNRKRAADELGISYKALLYKFKQFETDHQPANGRNGVV